MSDPFVLINDEDANPSSAAAAASSRSFDDDVYTGFDSFTSFADNESVKDSVDDSLPIYNTPPAYAGEDGFQSQVVPDTPSPTSIYGTARRFETFSPESNGGPLDDEVFGRSDGPVLPPPEEMHDEGFALREWRRLNAIQLAEKEKREKELLNQILDEADDYKVEFYRKRQLNVETNKSTNREKEKIYVAGQEKFYAEADKNYWKAIADLVPNEVVAIDKKRGKKDQDKKPSIVVIKGPKPGKPTDLSRMRQILIKLKHNPPPHMKPSPPPAPATANKDAKTGSAASTTASAPKAAAVTTPSPQPIAAA